jgi:hypothetical protein
MQREKEMDNVSPVDLPAYGVQHSEKADASKLGRSRSQPARQRPEPQGLTKPRGREAMGSAHELIVAKKFL